MANTRYAHDDSHKAEPIEEEPMHESPLQAIHPDPTTDIPPSSR